MNNINKKELDILFLFLAKQAIKINDLRVSYLKNLNAIFKKNYKKLVIKNFTFSLTSGWPSAENSNDLYNFLVKNRDKIIAKKQLAYGCHRADITFKLNNKNDKLLSRGEKK